VFYIQLWPYIANNQFFFKLQDALYSACQKDVPINCHCEERSDEAIFLKRWEIASLRSQ
jgi:hypothetical protein